MKKFAFIGAGSLQFTSATMRDLLTFPSFKDCEIALMDINADNLANIKKVCEKIRAEMNCPDCKVTATSGKSAIHKRHDEGSAHLPVF